jgi:hypothetical protein
MYAASDSPREPMSSSHVIDDGEDYEYYWSAAGVDFRIPRWLAEIIDVPLVVRWELFLIGVCTGLILAALAVLIAFYTAM